MFSLTLIVAIVVGYVARRIEMEGQRDQSLAGRGARSERRGTADEPLLELALG